MDRLTFKQLAEIESRLGDLAREMSEIADDGEAEHFCANEVWYGYGRPSLKKRMSALVGMYAPAGADPRLGNSSAYDVAYEHLYDLLPACRNCGCMVA